MNEAELQEPTPLNESAATAAVEPPSETAAPAGPSQPTENVHVPQRQPGVYAPITVDLPSEAESQIADFTAFMKRTWRMWAISAGAILGVFLTITVLERLTEMVRAAQLKRYDQAIASVTPERLVARCGQPEEDITKEVFPVVLRTMKYKPWTGEPLVFTFSRTAEQQSTWVFLTMKNDSGTKNFDAPESKISAFSCLDSKK